MGRTPSISVHVAGRVEICDPAGCVVTARVAKYGHGRGVTVFCGNNFLIDNMVLFRP